EFEIDLEGSTPAAIPADPQRLRQEVIGNLLANAFKFTPEGGRIWVKATADTMLRITVGDTGVGIPEELLPQIFDQYYQVRDDTARNPNSGGSGLGLAIVREVLEAHGGSIRAESTPGQGTKMHISLPLSTGPERSHARLRREQENAIFNG